MARSRAMRLSLVILVLAFIAGAAQAQIGTVVANWTVPSSSSSSASGLHHSRAQTDVTLLLPFIGVTPCRIVDTRGPAGPYGAPSLPASTPRSFALLGGPCAGLPAGVSAYSLNITVTNTLGAGFISLYPTGGAAPLVSTLNYVAGQTIANAAIVPAGTGGAITAVAGVSGTDLIIDINGYYSGTPGNLAEYFGVTINRGPGGVIFGENTNTTSAFTWGGNFFSDSTGGRSAGVHGDSTTGANNTSGVLGEDGDTSFANSFLPGPEGVTGINSFSGVLGIAQERAVVGVLLNTAGVDIAEGWLGKSGSSASVYYGVEGILLGTSAGGNSAGVKGIAADGEPPAPGVNSLFTAGVRGDSLNNYGVVGISKFIGTFGILVDGTGTITAKGELGLIAFGGPWGVFAEGNVGASGTKPFVEVHPTDPSKLIRYVALEGPEAGTYFRGTDETSRGMAVIPVPESFRLVTDAEGLTVQLTPIGAPATMYVVSQDLNQIVVRSSRDVKFHYMVNGIRATFKDWQVMVDGGFMPETATQTLPAYFSEEQRRRLVANGTYNSDGTVNMATVRRLGWDKVWEARAEATRQAAEANASASSDRSKN